MTEFDRILDWNRDPKHVLFVLARYKFVAKMLKGVGSVLEIGAGDGVASEIVRREVGSLVLTDIEPSEYVLRRDFMEGPMPLPFDAAYSLDVVEHVSDTGMFLRNIHDSLRPKGVCIIGTPSIESQAYASELSKKHHINCMSADTLHGEMARLFRPVFMFGMNDEVVHTGFDQMRHYNLAVGIK